MKTKLFLTAAVALSIVGLNAQNLESTMYQDCNADVQLNAKNQVVVRYLEADASKVKVFVYNQDGDQVHAKTIKAKGTIKLTYDLKNLPKGDLLFNVISNNKLACSELVRISENGLVAIPEPVSPIAESFAIK